MFTHEFHDGIGHVIINQHRDWLKLALVYCGESFVRSLVFC